MKENIGEMPLVTIGIPCFNAESTISRAIHSALKQDYQNFEVLIVDDHSNDSSCQVVESIISEKKHARLIINDENIGPGAVRRRIISEARGEYIAFFDDDDESLPARVSSQLFRLENYKNITGLELLACYTSGKRIYPNGYIKLLEAPGSRLEVPKGEQMADYLLFYGQSKGVFYGNGTPSCALMAHKNTYTSVGSFDPSLRRLEDVDFAIRLALAGGHFIGCHEKLLIQHSTDAPDKSPEMNLKAEQQVAEKYSEYLKQKKRFDYAVKWPLLRYYHFTRQYFKLFSQLCYLIYKYPIAVSKHILQTFPRRFLHENKMKKKIS